MANIRNLQRSFAGGEVSPDMYGRIDDVKYQTGAAKMRNFIARAQGPADNRPGFAYVNIVKTSAKKTRLIPFTYSTTQTMVLEFGDQYIRFHTLGATLLSSGTPYEVTTPYLEADLFDIHYVQSADVLTLVHPNYAPRELRRLGATSWTLSTIAFTPATSAPTEVTVAASGHSSVKYTYHYVVTAIAADGVTESSKSSDVSAGGNMLETGGICTISWSTVTGASRYFVYKLQGGIYGYVGSTTTTSIIDDNIAPDMGVTPPNYDTVFGSTGDYPGAVSYYEQRRSFAGTTNDPQKIWMTKSGTESNMAYSLPVKSDDRIAFKVAAREANTIRHIIPLTQLILLTSASEWQVSSVNSDALTPSSISVKPQSYIGASNVQPQIVNNTMVYCANRGNHVRELGYNWQSGGFITGDLSIRAAHLFDNMQIVDMTFAKAPQPVLWFVSSNGVLLGLTYVPEQQIGSWHWHDTDGTFESCAVVAENNEDVLYVVIKRTINGNSVRYIERMQSRIFAETKNCFFVDSGSVYNGANATATTVTVTGGTLWTHAETLTITASSAIFAYPATTDVNDAIVVTGSDGNKYRLTITGTTSTTVATVKVDNTLPASLRGSAAVAWSFARNTVSGLTWLEGKTVSILANGAVHPQKVVTSGSITLDRAEDYVVVGLPYVSDLQTLPLIIQVDGFGQGRAKNVNKAWLRVYRSSGIFIGPDETRLVEAKQRSSEVYGIPPSLKSDEVAVTLSPSWESSGEVYIRQVDPLPLTIVGLTIEVAIGG